MKLYKAECIYFNERISINTSTYVYYPILYLTDERGRTPIVSKDMTYALRPIEVYPTRLQISRYIFHPLPKEFFLTNGINQWN